MSGAAETGSNHGTWRRGLALSLGLALCVPALVGCAGRHKTIRYDREQLARSLDDPESESAVLLGDFTLEKVIDGDTLRVVGINETLRLLAIDTEETFKSEKARRAYEEGWETYLTKAQIDRGGKPVKIPTPLGEEAKKWAVEFFKGVRTVRLERDSPDEIRGRYNRLLTYVYAEKNGEWVNYNLESVRAGMSPYFTKYGYSTRFHDEFVAAQEEARAAQRGIWDPDKQHYLDYDLRIAWWNRRADFIAEFKREAAGRDNYIVLTSWGSPRALKQHLHREVVILATVGDIYPGDGRKPTRVNLSRRMFGDFPVVFFDEDVYASSGIGSSRGDFVRVRGVVSQYRNKRTGADILQIQVELPGQVARDPHQGAPRVMPGDRDWPLGQEVRGVLVDATPAEPREPAPTELAPPEPAQASEPAVADRGSHPPSRH
ncbi:MAG: thermonuclease family protein [Myxococcales bacterium]|nr:thermonuclease family protein [Myxococcales bacterium]MCB9750920.1 thermonuclease family protein [Myxococcales bacterium]